jgi:hypothetical protein
MGWMGRGSLLLLLADWFIKEYCSRFILFMAEDLKS